MKVGEVVFKFLFSISTQKRLSKIRFNIEKKNPCWMRMILQVYLWNIKIHIYGLLL